MNEHDASLVCRLAELASDERALRVEFLRVLAEFDDRRMFAELGCASSFAYLTDVLRFSGPAAYRRLTVARLVRRMPAILEHLRTGRLSMTKLCLLKDVLTEETCTVLLEQAANLSEREVEALALSLNPRRAVAPPKDRIRPLAVAAIATPPAPSTVRPDSDIEQATSSLEPPVAPEPSPVLYEVRMAVGPAFLERLEELRSALSHSHPRARLEDLLAHCMEVTLEQHERRCKAVVKKPRAPKVEPALAPSEQTATRHIPAAVRRAVWQRDEGRCAFVGLGGKRCGSTHRLELHHKRPFAQGGPATVSNLVLVCSVHNDLEARRDLGDTFMNQFTRRKPATVTPSSQGTLFGGPPE